MLRHSPIDILKDQPGLRPAPYLASRGMKWIQRQTEESMDDEALKDYIRESHRLVSLQAAEAHAAQRSSASGPADAEDR